HVAPAPAEHVLRGIAPVGVEPSLAQAMCELRVSGKPSEGCREGVRVSRRHKQGALLVHQQLAGRRRVGGDQRCSASPGLERLVGDHAPCLVGGAEDPERAAGAVELVRNALVVDPPDPLDIWWEVLESVLELAAADEAEWYLGGRAGRGDYRLDSVERDQLADEQARERLARGPAGT